MSEREAYWPDDPTARSILRQIESLGWRVSAFSNPGSLRGTVKPHWELHAVSNETYPPQFHAVRVFVHEHADAGYVAACRLAESVGIDLED